MSAIERIRPTTLQWLSLLLWPPILAGAAYGFGRMVGIAIAVWQLWLFVLVIVATLIVVSVLRGAAGRLPRPDTVVLPQPDSRPFAQAVRWEDRLSWSEVDADRFNTTVRERLVPVVAERLRLRHRVDWYAEPDRARALLPEPLFRLLTEPVAAPLNKSEMDEIVRQIESLSSEDRVNAEHH